MSGCGEKFKIDDSSYLKILEQVHNQEFEKQVKLFEENSLGKLQTKIDEFKKDHEKTINKALDYLVSIENTDEKKIHSIRTFLSRVSDEEIDFLIRNPEDYFEE